MRPKALFGVALAFVRIASPSKSGLMHGDGYPAPLLNVRPDRFEMICLPGGSSVAHMFARSMPLPKPAPKHKFPVI